MEREGGGKGAKQRAGDGDGGETITRADGDDEFDMRPTELQDIVQYSGRRAAWRTMAAAVNNFDTQIIISRTPTRPTILRRGRSRA